MYRPSHFCGAMLNIGGVALGKWNDGWKTTFLKTGPACLHGRAVSFREGVIHWPLYPLIPPKALPLSSWWMCYKCNPLGFKVCRIKLSTYNWQSNWFQGLRFICLHQDDSYAWFAFENPRFSLAFLFFGQAVFWLILKRKILGKSCNSLVGSW